jgi:hypothetical protein
MCRLDTHAFSELKHRFIHILEQSEKLEREGKSYIYKTIPRGKGQ